MKKQILLFGIALLISLSIRGQVTDMDGNNYNTVLIGNKEYMTENLNVSSFRNGDSIPEAKSKEEWINADKNKQPAWCYYNNIVENGTIYGKLYNWYAVNDSRELSPKGWHIPKRKEWIELRKNVGDKKLAGKKMKSESGWVENNNRSNESGFSGLPGGVRGYNGEFAYTGKYVSWWTSTIANNWNASDIWLMYNTHKLEFNNSLFGFGKYIRCFKN